MSFTWKTFQEMKIAKRQPRSLAWSHTDIEPLCEEDSRHLPSSIADFDPPDAPSQVMLHRRRLHDPFDTAPPPFMEFGAYFTVGTHCGDGTAQGRICLPLWIVLLVLNVLKNQRSRTAGAGARVMH